MPELPEVEAARALIAGKALHRRIAEVDDADTYVCRPHAPGELRSALLGRTLTAVHRRGKLLWCETSPAGSDTAGSDTAGCDTAGPELGIHLGMSGRIIVVTGGEAAGAGEPMPAWTRPGKAVWERFALEFADGGRLVLFDKRRLARVRLNPDTGALGPDARDVTREEFRALIMTGTVAVKARLLDQSKLAGVGNLLADEVLWQARLPPAMPAGRLRRADADRLHGALRSALEAALAQGGVHTGQVIPARRAGGTCPRCGAEMRHGTVGGRSTWWCSREQAWPAGPGTQSERRRTRVNVSNSV